MGMTQSELHGYALVGARAHLERIENERATILATFPELQHPALRTAITGKRTKASARASANETKRLAVRALANEIAHDAPAPRRRHMTAAARKAISKRMAAYWAKRRAEKGKA